MAYLLKHVIEGRRGYNVLEKRNKYLCCRNRKEKKEKWGWLRRN